MVQETLKADSHAGHLFVFRGKRGDLVKIIWHDVRARAAFAADALQLRFGSNDGF